MMPRLPFSCAPAPWTEAAAAGAAAAVLPRLINRFQAKRVLQVPAGSGVWLGACLTAGVDEVLGVGEEACGERAWVPRCRLLERRLDASLDLGQRFDLVLAPDLGSLPPGTCDEVAGVLARHGDVILVGDAAPDDPGDRCWLHALTALGFAPVDALPAGFAKNPAIAPWYRRGLKVLVAPSVRTQRGLRLVVPEHIVPTANTEIGWRPPEIERAKLSAEPTVAVIIPVHDYAHFLPDAVASVAAQTWPRIVCVVVDDGSTDDTAAVAEGLKARHPGLDLRVVQQPNLGVAQARNQGVRSVTAPLVMQLDADDRLEPEAIARLVAALRAQPTADVAHCDAREFGEGEALMAAAPLVTHALLRKGNCLNYCALLRRDLFLRVGGYRDIRGGYDDWDLWLSLAEAGANFAHVAIPLLGYRRHGKSLMDRERTRSDVLRAQVVRNHPHTFTPRELRLAADVLARDTDNADHPLGLRLRLGLDALLRGRLEHAWRHVART